MKPAGRLTALIAAAGCAVTIAGPAAAAASAAPSLAQLPLKAFEVLSTSAQTYVFGACWVQDDCGEPAAFSLETEPGACFEASSTGSHLQGCSFAAWGDFTTVTCGTGIGQGVGSMTQSDGPDIDLSDAQLVFVAGLGVFRATATDANGHAPMIGVMAMQPVASTSNIPSLHGACAAAEAIRGFLATALP